MTETTGSDPNQIAETLMAGRLALIAQHKASVEDEKEKREALAKAERQTAATWAAALAGGWTPQEMRRMTFQEPQVKGPGRPRKNSAGSKPRTPAPVPPQGGEQQPGTPGSVLPVTSAASASGASSPA
ncbi:hypothetical protein [Streptomyces alboflavus]|uniref:hypothetical protein n=1 Tax=Streptomyces alboflavus TaxID=67267 RepID=UPI000F658873|nr:hypothetical protein [Streptomyces alboflavus]